MGREADIMGFTAALLTITAGATNALAINPCPGQVGNIVKYISGGTLEIHGAPLYNPTIANSSTAWAGASLVALQGTGYPMAVNETVPYDGAARYYLMATGSNVTVAILRGISSNG